MSVVEDVRKVLQDFLAPELRSMSTRMDALEKQRVEDKSEILRAIFDLGASMDKRRLEDKADLLRVIADGKADTMRLIAEGKADTLRFIAEGNAHMEKRFELVIDYTKVLQRMDRLEESRQAEQH